MMIEELQPGEFSRVLPLYRVQPGCFPLISAVIQELQRGSILVDNRERPSVAVVITSFGFMLAVGSEHNQEFNAGLTTLLREGRLAPSYLLWSDPPANWSERLEAAGPGLVRKRERARFEFQQAKATWLDQEEAIQTGFTLQPLTAELLSQAEKFGLNLDSRFWSSATDLLEHGLGVCLVKDGQIASICYAAAVVDGVAEVDVATDKDLRAQGLANIVAQEFIRRSLGHGIMPTWDCFLENAGSMRLAEKLGFAEAYRYQFYSLNIPLPLP